MQLKFFKRIYRFKIAPTSFAYLFLIISLSATFLAYLFTLSRVQNQRQVKFQSKADIIYNNIQSKLNLYLTSLYGLQGFFTTSDKVTADEWTRYLEASDIFHRFPGISVFTYAPRVTDQQLPEFVRQQQKAYSGFNVFPKLQKDEYYPTIYVEPKTANLNQALGFDLLSETVRRSALEQARDTNKAVATEQIILLTNKKPGFTIILPIYKNDQPHETLTERRQNTIGFITGGFRPEELFPSLMFPNLIPQITNDLKVEIFDNSNNFTPNQLLYTNDNGQLNYQLDYFASQDVLTATKTLVVAEKPWSIRFSTLPGFTLDPFSNRLPVFVLLVGADSSILLFLTMMAIARTQTHALTLAQNMLTRAREKQRK
jgi:CHASE1-domain containing sensor protein